ncbi:MAG: ParB/RepB/Spo0J family partition protein [Pseudomonadota bacterium]
MSAKKRGLGRGLDALLTNNNASQERQAQQPSEQIVEAVVKGELQKLPIESLKPGRYQPRKDMSPEALEDLAASVKAQGIIQPIVVRPTGQDDYEIIAGERRWRAAQLAKLDVVPCLIKEVTDEAAVAIALIENIQREDLNAMEEANALQRLLDDFQMTHQDVAQAVGKSRTTVTNLLRLNNLESPVKTLLERGDIDLGHAKLLLALEGEQQAEIAQQIVAKDLTVREAEKVVRKTLEPAKPVEQPKPDADIERLQTQLTETLGAKVAINHGRKGKGKLVINYGSLDELDGILSHIK